MASFPCEFTAHRFRGRAWYAYPTALNGTLELRRRLRMCPEHGNDYVTYADGIFKSSLQIELGDDPDSHTCAACGTDNGKPMTHVYLTFYAGKDDRADLYGLICSDCVQEVVDSLKLG